MHMHKFFKKKAAKSLKKTVLFSSGKGLSLAVVGRTGFTRSGPTVTRLTQHQLTDERNQNGVFLRSEELSDAV